MKIFIVDEEPELAALLARTFASRGVATKVVRSAEQGLHELQAESVNLALLDLSMPHLDAFEVIAGIKKLDPSLGMVLVSGSAGSGKSSTLEAVLGAVAERKEPPVPTGRRVKDTVTLEKDEWLRLEYVPCGSPRCRRDPDEHGPYWYRYYWTGTGWRSKYLGRSFPIKPPTFERVRQLISSLARKDRLADDDIRQLRNLVAQLTTKQAGARRLRAQGAALLVREQARREEAVDRRYADLIRKVFAGKTLTEKEARDLQAAATLLSEAH